ncbi:MAG: hypothetical protein ACK40Z_14815, partial [Dietzia sp.]
MPPGAQVIFKERWCAKEARVRLDSPLSTVPGWALVPIIVKSGDDLRQEQFASQLLRQFQKVFRDEGLSVFVRPYDIVATSPDSGVIEAIPDTISIDALKRNHPRFTSLQVRGARR